MSDSIQVVLVSNDDDRRTRDARAIARFAGLDVVAAVPPDAVESAIDDADCVVTDDPDISFPDDGPPVVAFADVDPEVAARAGVEGFVRRSEGVDGTGTGTGPETGPGTGTGIGAPIRHLVDHLRFLTTADDGHSAASRADRRKIHRLHDGTADIVAARSMAALYERTVAVAEEILEFDVCYLLVREDDRFVPRASSSVPTETGLESVPVDHGLTGHTDRTGRSFLVQDLEADPHAEPVHGDYGSGISVPVGDWGVFQATAKERRAFDEADLELAELLLSYANATRRRIDAAAELRERQETIERLHESTAEVVGCRSESRLAEVTVAAAETVLSFEACVVLFEAAGRRETGDDADEVESAVAGDGEDAGNDVVAGDGEDAVGEVGDGEDAADDASADPTGDADTPYVVRAASGGDLSPPVGSSHDPTAGILGKTVRTGTSQLVDDVREDPDARPYDESYRSALSVPIGDRGAFVAMAGAPGAYDEADRRLAELLISHVGEVLSRIRVEQTLREREATLRQERDRLAALFENVPDAVAEFTFEDGDPIVTNVNGVFEETFGYDLGDVGGESIDDYIVPTGRDREAADLNEKLLAGERLRRTVRRRTADDVRDFLLHVVPIEVGERNVHGYAIYTDVTEQKRHERELERQNERLDQFASIVSHDLRNPLNVASGHLDLARSSCDDGALDRVAESHDRMSRMIDELLALARQGELVGDTVPVELRETAESAWATVATADATLSIADDTVLVADRGRFVELLENLFRNAVDHAGSEVAVTVGTGDAGVYVADDGPGIPEGDRARVFESGYTTAETGTGFGLTIVDQIADAHGWSVSVGESEDGGARFEFSIPDDSRSMGDSRSDPESRRTDESTVPDS